MKCLAAAVVLAACASNPAPVSPPPPAPADAAPAPVAAVDAAPAIPPELAAAPAYVFRFHAGERLETWTLRFTADRAMIVREGHDGTTTYVGTATDGTSLTVEVASATAKLSLHCQRDKLAAGTSCGDPKPKNVDILACYAPGYDTPMSFGQPGIEYVADPTCAGYRLMK